MGTQRITEVAQTSSVSQDASILITQSSAGRLGPTETLYRATLAAVAAAMNVSSGSTTVDLVVSGNVETGDAVACNLSFEAISSAQQGGNKLIARFAAYINGEFDHLISFANVSTIDEVNHTIQFNGIANGTLYAAELSPNADATSTDILTGVLTVTDLSANYAAIDGEYF